MALLLAACGGDDGWGDSGQKKTADQDQDAVTGVIDSTYEYQLPVIFHVLYKDKNDASQYIPASRLRSLLRYVNQIYQGGIYGKSADVRLKFVPAEHNENGKTLSTPGVEYIEYSGDFPIDEEVFMASADNVKYIWDPNDYINVMLFPFKKRDGGEVLGLSHLPYTPKGTNALSGLETVDEAYIGKNRLGYPRSSAINSTYAGQSATGGYYQSDRYTASNHEPGYIIATDVVVTLAHELGHYLGLYHIFTESNEGSTKTNIFDYADSCADTDYCKDTPSYNRREYNNYLSSYMASTASDSYDIHRLLRRHACNGSVFESDNIMDYAFTLGFKITQEQKTRIRNVLYHSPLIPGPKLNGVNKRTRAANSTQGGIYTNPQMIR